MTYDNDGARMNWHDYTSSPGQMVQTELGGRECWLLSAGRNDVCGKWGDTPEHPHKRAQKVGELFQLGDTMDFKFSLYFPETYKTGPDHATSLMDIHQDASAAGLTTPWTLKERAGEMFLVSPFKPAGKWFVCWLPWRSGHWYHFHWRMRLADDETGHLHLWMNRRNLLDLSGIQTAYGPSYPKVGPLISWYADRDAIETIPYIRQLGVIVDGEHFENLRSETVIHGETP